MPILDRLNKAQGGHAFANLARAFHLPPGKVEPAVETMVAALIPQIEAKLRSRRFLARLVELLDERAHHQVLENPTMLGTTSTQVLGNQALNAIAGREASKRIARQAASRADVSEMVAEYLLPVVAAMLVGAIADASRERLEGLMRQDRDGGAAAGDPLEAAPVIAPLPQVAAGGVGFSGSTGGGVSLATPAAASGRLTALAACIREGRPPPAVPPMRRRRRAEFWRPTWPCRAGRSIGSHACARSAAAPSKRPAPARANELASAPISWRVEKSATTGRAALRRRSTSPTTTACTSCAGYRRVRSGPSRCRTQER